MAIDWTIPRLGVFRFHRVDYSTRAELEELTTIEPGGSITRNLETELKEEGTLPCVDPSAIGDDLVRVYYVVEDDAGNEESIPLATMHAVKSSAKYTAAAQSASLKLISALLTLQQTALKRSLTIAAGAGAVAQAATLATSLGLPVVTTASAKTLGVDVSWDAGTSYLKILNYLLEYAGFWSTRIDPWGRVLFESYQAPSERAPVWDFAAGANCIYLPDVTVASDAFDVPNVCVLTMSNPGGTLVGSYENDDPASLYSTAARGREIVLAETVTDAVDEADLNARAQRRLVAATGATETVGIKHAYAPVKTGDAVGFAWSAHGLSMRATVQSQSIALAPAGLTTATLRRVWA